MDRSEVERWYGDNQRRYQDLAENMETLLRTILREKDIPHYSVTHRVKERETFLEKWERKQYTDPLQEMDFAGVRIITQTTAEVKRVCAAIREEFRVDEKNSGDKSSDLASDRVGYLSVHYVASLSEGRLGLAEYARFRDMRCEIQVRSLLQNAWAEIEHDRGYKFAGKLPPILDRRFHLVAGVLEMMDREFCALSDEIDAYAKQVQHDTEEGKLDIPIDSISLLEYLDNKLAGQSMEKPKNGQQSNLIIQELHDFGVGTLRQLEELLKRVNYPADAMTERSPTYIGFLRDAMVLADAETYFGSAWKNHWIGVESESLKYWYSRGVKQDLIEKMIRAYHLKILPAEYEPPDYEDSEA